LLAVVEEKGYDGISFIDGVQRKQEKVEWSRMQKHGISGNQNQSASSTKQGCIIIFPYKYMIQIRKVQSLSL
jgi:hypothetical protein